MANGLEHEDRANKLNAHKPLGDSAGAAPKRERVDVGNRPSPVPAFSAMTNRSSLPAGQEENEVLVNIDQACLPSPFVNELPD